MTAWKWWPLRYRIGVHFSFLLLLLQAGGCTTFYHALPTYPVPGITGSVYPEKFQDYDGRRYYRIKNPGGEGRYISEHTAFEGSPEYKVIDAYFRTHPEIEVARFDRSAIPGGTGLPPPPLQ